MDVDGHGSGRPDLNAALRRLRIELGILNDKVASAAGLNPRDLDLLDVVTHDGPCTPTQLAARTGVRAATLTGMLARLERDGWITRTPDRSDGRSVHITAAARIEQLTTLYATADARVGDLTAAFSQEEKTVIARFLNQVADAARLASDQLSPSDART
ncbi:MarR family winged helix-turn-helix transcriptional regulator [Goodfellowiella coeruleoviolacea]|uniref:DNA-binding transcriptional regulator, MarR family n=1 Tax=Goodfellowiella coeruleoviolacea TaxID=334858 RepID=A0AAE3GJW3_9PSEU|nr:MarR family transcriptional regulator [Goodfellowiella coeruleoviolacea]MCP2167518.1 DNA-binding transcriptional regulator, MarR family [Goodfellowiella coeruleoviolacea]